MIGVLLAVSAVVSGCSSGGDPTPSASASSASASSAPIVTVGGGDTTELKLLQQLYVQLLDHAGYQARLAPSTADRATDRATELSQVAAGSVSVVPDYLNDLGTFLTDRSGTGTPSTASTAPVMTVPAAGASSPGASSSSASAESSSAAAAAAVTAALAAVRPQAQAAGVDLLTPAKADRVNAFVVLTSVAKAEKLTTLSDLAALGRPVAVAADPSCPRSSTCQPALTSAYGLTVSEFIPVDVPTPAPSTTRSATTGTAPSATAGTASGGTASSGSGSATSDASSEESSSGPSTTPIPLSQGLAIRQMLTSKLADLGVLSTTDEVVSESGVTVLADDRHTQPANNVVPVVTPSLATQTRLVKALNSLAPVLTTADLAQMDGQVDAQHLAAAQVARSYLKDKNLI